MSDAQTQRLLVVANRTECAPHLLQEIERRAHADATFLLIVPPERHPDAPDWTPDEALRLVQRAARGRPVELVDCGEDAAGTVSGIVASGGCDAILLSTQREHHPHWHRHSLPEQIEELGIPTTVIPPDATGWSADHGFPEGWVRIEVGPLT